MDYDKLESGAYYTNCSKAEPYDNAKDKKEA